jgi:hypothetical protein
MKINSGELLLVMVIFADTEWVNDAWVQASTPQTGNLELA